MINSVFPCLIDNIGLKKYKSYSANIKRAESE